MLLDVWSDVICPWCWLGHARLHVALERLGGEEVQLRYRAFRLDPRATDRPGDLRAAIEAKYGPGAFDAMTRRLVALGAGEGIDYRFERALRVSSLDAHRLIQATQDDHAERTSDLVERLYRAYFHDGANIADHGTLVTAATDVGLDGDWAAGVLGTERGLERVRAEQTEALELGVTGVPAVAYQGAVLIPGAQEVDTMLLVLSRLRARTGG
jgi:predicted DsbA family dithiol-disulfide isomerase